MAEDNNHLPNCKVLARSKQNVELFEIGGGGGTVLLEGVTTTLQAISPDGSAAYVHVVDTGIVKCDLTGSSSTAKADAVAFLENTQGVQMMHLSPGGNYILTWERWYNNNNNNLKAWNATTGKLLCAFPQKALSREAWPYLQFTVDEEYAFLVVNNSQVRVYRASDLCTATEPRYIDRLQVPCHTLSLPQHAGRVGREKGSSSSSFYYYFTAFTPKTKDKPGVVTVYEYDTKSFLRKASKSLFQAEECTTHWCPATSTTACLMTLQTAVDVSGESYYGSSQLLLWNNTSNHSDQVTAVPLPQDGPVQAVHWLRHPDKPPSFIAVAGRMPAMASQHHGLTGAVTFLFGNNVHRNTVAPSPHSRFVCLAGFGNLAGGMGFWDVNKKKLVPHVAANVAGQLRAEAVTSYSWSPDSRYFLVCTTAPRMNVDNGLRLYKYTGELVVDTPWDNANYQPNRLLEACFVPALPHIYPDRPQSPIPEPTTEQVQAAAAPPIADTRLPASGRYVPPSARNRAGGSSLAERMRREKEGQLQGATKVVATAAVSATTGRAVVGMASGGGGKSKSQVKREKLKKKKEQAAVQQVKSEETPTEEQAAAADPEKRARKIKKTLKQIEDLRQKSDLNDDQKAKIATEEELRAELEQLGL